MQTKHQYSKELTEVRNSLINNNKELNNRHSVSIELEKQIATLRNKSEELEIQKGDAPKYFSEITVLEESISKNNSVVLKRTAIELEHNIANLKLEGLEVKSFKVEGLDEIIASKFNNNALSKIAKDYSETISTQKSLNNKVVEIQVLLDGTKLQADSISTLIKLGSQLINQNQNQDGNCPLCQHKHESFTVLADAINSNSSLSDTQQRLLKDIEACQTLLKLEDEKLKKLNNDFSEQKENCLNLLREQLLTLLSEKKLLSNTLEQVAKDNAEVNRLKELTCHKTPENFQLYIDEEVEKNSGVNALIETQLGRIKAECKNLTEDNQNLKVYFSELTSKSENDNEFIADYLFFLDELRLPSEVIEPEVKEQELKAFISSQLQVIVKFFDEKSQEVKANDEALSLLSAEYTLSFFEKPDEKVKNLTLQVTKCTEDLILLNKSVSEFYTMTKRLGEDRLLEDGNWALLKQAFAHEVSALYDKRKESTVLLSKLTSLTSLAEQVLKYIKFVKSTDELQQSERKIDKYDRIKEALITDLRGINESLESQINHYFHVDLINTIYKKIDPHPDFKHIDFRCSFPEDGKPKLQVYITDDDGNNIVSPTLSFSSAQVNVLSLSIFLAKALHTKNEDNAVDCIFIDDPVQSMDSINVLGVIDLLRGLSLNLGKQIIISTHDDNFHALLKQKFPKELFKSKFLELESFGKVAPHASQ